MPVPWNRDLFARQTAAVLEPAFTDHRLQSGFAKIGAEGEIILPRANQNYIPLAIDHTYLSCPSDDFNRSRRLPTRYATATAAIRGLAFRPIVLSSVSFDTAALPPAQNDPPLRVAKSAYRKFERLEHSLLQKYFSVLCHLLGESLLVHLDHVDQLNLTRIRERRINAFARNKLADIGHDLKALFTEKKIEECLTRADMGCLGSQADGLPVAHEFAGSHVVQRHAVSAVKDHILEKCHADRSFTSRNAFPCGRQRRNQQRL